MILTELVTENYDKLNKNDLKIYSYIMINKARFIEKNINELGNLLDLSPSSIVGFSKKLGLDGFSELRYVVKWATSYEAKFDENEIEYTKNDINLTMSMMMALNLNDFYEKLNKANRIFAIASGYTQRNAADEIKRNFITVDKTVFLLDKSAPKSITDLIKKDDILFVYSLSGENEEILNFIENLKEKPIIASVTKLSNNRLSQISDYSIPFVTHEVFEYESRTKFLQYLSFML